MADARYDLLPERKLLMGLIPVVGGPIAGYLQDRRDRNAKRAAEFQTAMFEESRLSPQEILQRIAEDERLEELFWSAVRKALQTSARSKRRAYARIMAGGLDDARIEDTQFYLRVLDDIEPAEITLMRVASTKSDLLRPDATDLRSHELPAIDVATESEIKAQLVEEYGEVLFDYLVARLRSLSLMHASCNVPYRTGAESGSTTHYCRTEFGDRMLH